MFQILSVASHHDSPPVRVIEVRESGDVNGYEVAQPHSIELPILAGRQNDELHLLGENGVGEFR